MKGRNDSFRVQAVDGVGRIRKLNAKWSEVRVPSLGWVKFRATRPAAGEMMNVTFALRGDRWFVSFACRIETGAAPSNLPAVGIDRGVAQTLTLSTGEHIQAPRAERLARLTKRAQRRLMRCRKGSARRAAQRRKVAKLMARAGRRRADWCHKASTSVARCFGLVAIEALDVQAMTASASGPGRAQKAGLNRSILAQSWGQFARLLDYKLTERGGVLISVPAAYTSQTCASCGVVDARSRKSQAVFACVHCDHTDNADVNAAKEILRRSTAWLGAEGTRWGPVEPPIKAAA